MDDGQRGDLTNQVKNRRVFYQEIGKLGRAAVLARRGPTFFTEAGRKGGRANAERHDHDFFVELGRRGAAARAANKRAREAAEGQG